MTHPPNAAGQRARTITRIDGLGRTESVETVADATPGTKSRYGYDLHGELAYTTDGVRTASLIKHDALGRETERVSSDGTQQRTTWTAWDEVEESIALDASDKVVARRKREYQQQGRLVRENDQMLPETPTTSGIARSSVPTWTAGDAAVGSYVGQAASIDAAPSASEPIRGTTTTYDAAARGRVSVQYGSGVETPNQVFVESKITDYQGTVAKQGKVYHGLRSSTASLSATQDYDELGRLEEIVEPGKFTSTFTHDQAGNLLESTPAGLGTITTSYDSRGLPVMQQSPTGGTLEMQYDALGGVIQRTDESGSGNTTTYERDALGRVAKITYPDGTTERTVFEDGTGQVSATCDRAGVCLSYAYDAGGRISAVHKGLDANAPGTAVVVYEYDAAGRLRRSANKDAAIEFDEYDLLGHPHVTRTYRYASESGLADDPAARAVRDVHTQGHVWNVFGERTRWRMPAAGAALPSTEEATSPWRQWIEETRDGAGNLLKQVDVASATGPPAGFTITTMTAAGVGELATRSRNLDAGGAITSTYEYRDTNESLPDSLSGAAASLSAPLASGRLRKVTTTHGATLLAGQSVFPGLSNQIGAEIDLALGDRGSRFDYDARGRLITSKLQVPSDDDGLATSEGGAVDKYSVADFHKSHTSIMALSAAQHAALGTTTALATEPQTWSASEKPAHQVDVRSLFLDGVEVASSTYAYADGRQQTDGVWQATYDEFGRLIQLENDSTTPRRRIVAAYDPNDRLIARTAYHATSTGWIIDDVPQDNLPPDTTFVWDPMSDRLLAIATAGASTAQGAAADAGLLRQYVHGDQAYDDPIEVLVAQSGNTVKRYLPIVEEAGSGSITAVGDGSTGSLAERVLYADAYGAAPRYLRGPVVDRMTLEAEKNADGTIKRVTIEAHLTERIREATATTGLRIRTLTSTGSVAATATGAPAFDDTKPYAITWQLTPSDWNALTTASGAATLEIAVTDAIRSDPWGDVPPAPSPAWTSQVYQARSNTTEPVAVRRSLENVDAFLAGIGRGESKKYPDLYEIKNLYLAASETSTTSLFTAFHANPFTDPATHLGYARNRWYDPSTGSFLSPDPAGYGAGSSNLYAFGNGDPVNHRDPTGLLCEKSNASSLWDWTKRCSADV